MQIPAYIRRPLETAAARNLYRGQLLLGYVSPTSVAWFAALDDDGQIVDALAEYATPDDYKTWAALLKGEARRRNEAVVVFELGDYGVSGLAPSSDRLQ